MEERASAAHTEAQSWKIDIQCILDMPWNLFDYTAGDIFRDNMLLFRNNASVIYSYWPLRKANNY